MKPCVEIIWNTWLHDGGARHEWWCRGHHVGWDWAKGDVKPELCPVAAAVAAEQKRILDEIYFNTATGALLSPKQWAEVKEAILSRGLDGAFWKSVEEISDQQRQLPDELRDMAGVPKQEFRADLLPGAAEKAVRRGLALECDRLKYETRAAVAAERERWRVKFCSCALHNVDGSCIACQMATAGRSPTLPRRTS